MRRPRAPPAPSADGAAAPRSRGRPELSLSRLMCPRLLDARHRLHRLRRADLRAGAEGGTRPGAITENELTSADRPEAGVVAHAGAIDGHAAGLSPLAVPHRRGWRFRIAGSPAETAPGPRAWASGPSTSASQASRCRRRFPSDATLELEGALRPIERQRRATAARGPAEPFQTDLAEIVNAPGIAEAIDPQADPLLAPPLYGRWHAARATVTPGGAHMVRRAESRSASPQRGRASGTRVVQEHQEALMAAAWEQAADLQRANQRMRQLQLSLAVNASLHTRHLMALDDEAVLRVGAPAFGRLRPLRPAPRRARRWSRASTASALPPKATSAAMRRIGRERGPITRRVATQGGTRSATTTWVARLNTDGGDVRGAAVGRSRRLRRRRWQRLNLAEPAVRRRSTSCSSASTAAARLDLGDQHVRPPRFPDRARGAAGAGGGRDHEIPQTFDHAQAATVSPGRQSASRPRQPGATGRPPVMPPPPLEIRQSARERARTDRADAHAGGAGARGRLDRRQRDAAGERRCCHDSARRSTPSWRRRSSASRCTRRCAICRRSCCCPASTPCSPTPCSA